MKLKKLTDKELLSKTMRVVATEKKYTLIVLEHLQEIENRKLYCELGISSLFSYCLKILNYTPAQATVRVNATRLISQLPQAKEQIDPRKPSKILLQPQQTQLD